jgi:hypothetical protein
LDLLVSCFADDEILHRPLGFPSDFQWIENAAPCEHGGAEVSGQRVLYILDENDCECFLEKHESAFCLSFQKSSMLPPFLEHHGDRVIVIQSHEEFQVLFFSVQSFFFSIVFWLNELEKVILRKGSLQNMLDIGAMILDKFIYVCDDARNLIASINNGVSPDLSFRDLKPGDSLLDTQDHGLEDGPVMTQRIMKALLLIQNEGSYNYQTITYLVKIREVCLFRMIMLCGDKGATKNDIILFGMLAQCVTDFCKAAWQNNVFARLPYYPLFEKLISDEHVDAAYLEAQIGVLGIPEGAEYKLLQIKLNETSGHETTGAVVKAAKQLNSKKCFCFPYNSNLLVLCYSNASDSQLSQNRIHEDLLRYIWEPFGGVASSSQVFDSIRDLNFAYRQTNITFDYKDIIDAEIPDCIMEKHRCLYTFEDSLIFYLITQKQIDNEFLAFSFSHTILEKIARDDREHGTNDIQVLWYFYYFNRKVSDVAEYLHMHRNTILYRIEKIEKRFDFDLSEQGMRDRLLIDYKIYFIAHADRNKLPRLIKKASDY